jgi:hypothetical protein
MEIDVRLTGDASPIPICWHDHDVEINGGRTPVIKLPFAEIKRKYPHVSTFAEMLDAAAEKSVRLVVEMKTGMAGARGLVEESFDVLQPEWIKDLEKKLGIAVGIRVKEHLEQSQNSLAPYIITSFQKRSVLAAREQLSEHRDEILFTKMYFDLPKLEKWGKKWRLQADNTIGKNHYDGLHFHLSDDLMEKNFEQFRKIRDIIGEHTQLIVFTVDDPEHLGALHLLPPFYRPNHIITNCVQQAQQQQAQLVIRLRDTQSSPS